MASRLTKPVRRMVQIAGKDWVITLQPADPECRFDRIIFRQKRHKMEYWLPLETARNTAVTKWIESTKKDIGKRRIKRGVL